MAQIFIVSFDEPGVIAKGKGSATIVKRLSISLRKMAVDSEILDFNQLLARGRTSDPDSYALLHYNELFVLKQRKVTWLRAREKELKALGYRILHSVEYGRIIGDKNRQNKVLTGAGVPMPRALKDGDKFETAFSNEANDAHVPVHVINSGGSLDEDRYNTDYIDCRYDYQGEVFHVCLRAMAIGSEVLFAWVRASQEPNVRSRNTPVDADLIRHFHRLLVRPNMDRIKDISSGVKNALGVGFFAHDILPCAKSGKLYLCETNYKFYEGFYRFHMAPIADRHPVPAFFDGRKVGRRMARALISQLELDREVASN